MSKLKFIYVPQGCYAEVHSSTPENVLGLVTSGIGSCCSIIIVNSKNEYRYIALCHADDKTDLESIEHGIPALVNRACPDGDFTNLEIYVGEEEALPRNNLSPIYLNQIKRVLQEFKVSTEICLNLESKLVTKTYDEVHGLSISRKAYEILDKHHEKNVIEEELAEEDIDISELQSFGEDGFLLESSIIHGRSYAAKEHAHHFPDAPSKKFPPILVFDGSGESFLPLNMIEHICNSYEISWERIINDATSSYKGSERYSSYFESETSEIKEELALPIKQQELLLNKLLAPQGLKSVDVGGEGNCFFHTIAHQLGLVSYNPKAFQELRQLSINYMLTHPLEFVGFTEETLDDYIAHMSQEGAWADNPVMQALVNELHISVRVLRPDGSITTLTPTTNIDIPRAVSLAYTGTHYLSVEPIVHGEVEEQLLEIEEILENTQTVIEVPSVINNISSSEASIPGGGQEIDSIEDLDISCLGESYAEL